MISRRCFNSSELNQSKKIYSRMSNQDDLYEFSKPIPIQSTELRQFLSSRELPLNVNANLNPDLSDDDDPIMVNQFKEKEIKDQHHIKLFQQVFKQKFIKKKSTNVGKKFVDILIKYLSKFKRMGQFTGKGKRAIDEEISNLQEQRKSRRNKEFKFQDLPDFFSKLEQKMEGQGPRIRRAFSFVLRDCFKQSMKGKRSQVNDKVRYLFTAKLYRIRCRNHELSKRNQSN